MAAESRVNDLPGTKVILINATLSAGGDLSEIIAYMLMGYDEVDRLYIEYETIGGG